MPVAPMNRDVPSSTMARPSVACSPAEAELDCWAKIPSRAKLCRATQKAQQNSAHSLVPPVPLDRCRVAASAAHRGFAVSNAGRNRGRTSSGRHFHACRRRRSQERKGTSEARSSQVLRARSCSVPNALPTRASDRDHKLPIFARSRFAVRTETLRPKTEQPQFPESCLPCPSNQPRASRDRPLQTR